MCMFFSNPCPSCSVSCCCPSPLCVCVRLSQQHGACLDHCFKLFFPRCHPCLDCCVSLPLTLWVTPQFVSYGALEKLPADRTNKPLRCLFFLDFLYVLSAAQNEETWKKFRSGGQWSTFHSGGKIIQCPCAGGTWFPLFYGLKANQNISGGCCNSRDEPVEPLRLKLTLRALWFRHYIRLMGFSAEVE